MFACAAAIIAGACDASGAIRLWVHYQPSGSHCCRTDYLGRTLSSLAGLAGLDQVTVYVSQDGQAAAVKDVVQEYGQGLLAPPNTRGFQHWQRDRVPQLGPKQASLATRCSCAPRLILIHH